MSLSSVEEVKCACGEVFESELYQSVSAGENPELKEAILAGELNVVKCPSCFSMVYAERFVLYHDAENELMAFVYPKEMEEKREEIEKTMGSSFARLQEELPPDQKIKYLPFLIFSLDSLCALIKAEDDLADEVAVVETLCESLNLSRRNISLDAARRRRIPFLIPCLKGASKQDDPALRLREEVIAGLKKVLETNPHLERYKELLAIVETNSGWAVHEKKTV